MTGLESEDDIVNAVSWEGLGKRAFSGEADPVENAGDGKSRLTLEGLGASWFCARLFLYASIRKLRDGFRSRSTEESGFLGESNLCAFSGVLGIVPRSSAECAHALFDTRRRSPKSAAAGMGGASLLLLLPAPRSTTDLSRELGDRNTEIQINSPSGRVIRLSIEVTVIRSIRWA
jgi:hypothetical protein